MTTFQQKVTRHTKRQKYSFKGLIKYQKQSQIWQLELSDQEFFKVMINMLRSLMKKGENLQEQMDNISTEMEILRNNQK